MLLGAYIDDAFVSPDDWILKAVTRGYEAVVFPLLHNDDPDKINDCVRLLKKYNIISAEIGAWSNIISVDDEERKKAVSFTANQLYHADMTGTRCCINISGSKSNIWCGAHKDNYSEDTKTLIIDTVREIIDTVKPKNAKFALETMQWALPYSADSYLELIKKIDRKEFAVHLDIVNLINSPRKYLFNDALTKECIQKLGKYTVSVHLKDIIMEDEVLSFRETAPGQGNYDFKTLFKYSTRLSKDTTAIIEHLKGDEFVKAFEYLKNMRNGLC